MERELMLRKNRHATSTRFQPGSFSVAILHFRLFDCPPDTEVDMIMQLVNISFNERPSSRLLVAPLIATCVVLWCFESRLPAQSGQNTQLLAEKPFKESALSDADREFFEKRIRPVLVANCYECHNSVDSTEGGLAIDWRGGVQEGGNHGSLRDKYEGENLLLAVVRHEIPGLEMPEGGAKLGKQEISDFEKWVQRGLPDPRTEPPGEAEIRRSTDWPAQLERRKQWWSLQPIKHVEPPSVQSLGWPRDAIDQFVLYRIEDAGLQPAPEASPELLIKRLHYALTGLPPTAAEVQDFVEAYGIEARGVETRSVENEREAAYEHVVDDLLSSEHFGERWARHWMDWVRYADSHGSEGDPPIVGAHHYRDYLIRSLNQDVPYDQLVREHIAGDLLPEHRVNPELGINESLIATAHWRFVFHGFAPTDALDEKVRFTDDAINVFSKAFLGMTVSCARCHNHKFDAISQADYYAMFGIVGSARPGRSAIELPEVLLKSAERLATLKEEIKRDIITAWQNISPEELANRLSAAAGQKNAGEIAKQWRALGKRAASGAANQQQIPPESETNDAQAETSIANREFSHWYGYGAAMAASIQQAAKPVYIAARERAGSFSVSENPTFVIGSINPSGYYSNLRSSKLPARMTSPDFNIRPGDSLHLLVRGGGGASVRFAVQDYPRDGTVFPVKKLSQPADNHWHWQRFDLDYWKGDSAHIELAHAADGPLLAAEGGRSHFGLRKALIVPSGAKPPNLKPEAGDYLLSHLDSHSAIDTDSLPQVFHTALQESLTAWRAQSLTDAQALFLDACVAENILPNRSDELLAIVDAADQYRKLEEQIPSASRVPTLAEHLGNDHPLFVRGNHKEPSALVPRRFLEAIDDSPYETQLSGRLQLANDMFRRDNPLTSRVIVNRLWHHLFGRGIVATPDNLGRLGELPTHPEMLDYLAAEFEHSHTWHLKQLIRRIVMSSTWRQASTPVDPERVAEVDPINSLWSHTLPRRLDAESIRDSILVVSGQLDPRLFGKPVSGKSPRRSIYVRAQRNAMDPFLTTFNSPVPFSTKGRRDATNVPAQSLFLMNAPFVAEHAKRLAAQLDGFAVQDQRAQTLWRMILGRAAQEHELKAAAKFIAAQGQQYTSAAHLQEQLNDQIDERRAELESLRQKALAFWQMKTEQNETPQKPHTELPAAVWEFDSTAEIQTLSPNGHLQGSARIDASGLLLDGQGWLESPVISTPLHAKTLIAEVQLSGLDQRGGGVISVQTPDGQTFDAIVYGEQESRKWIAGSNHFSRTQPFANATAESAEGRDNWIHLALVVSPESKAPNSSAVITLYRDGSRYGQSYKTQAYAFAGKQWRVLLGLRHGISVTGNRALRGRVRKAAVYDSALDAGQIATLSKLTVAPETKELLRLLSEAERKRHGQIAAELKELNEEALQFSKAGWPQHSEKQAWIDLAHALLNTKEFLYVR